MSAEGGEQGEQVSRQHDGLIEGLSHISLHVRDVDEAIGFWTTIFQAEPYEFAAQPESGRAHLGSDGRPTCVELAGTVLHFSTPAGISGWDAEYPHVGFTVGPEQLRELKHRLEEAGVPTHPLWTRNQVEALMYFRDPSGNLFEFYCWQYDRIDDLALDSHKGGTFRPPVHELTYDWDGKDRWRTGAGGGAR